MQFGKRILAAVAVVTVFSLANTATAQEYIVGSGPQLFANQYTQGYANQATAQMYLAPVPVPAWVGHTYYTYQPLYPHEMMYRHTDRYHSYYDAGRGLNRTRIHYSAPPVRSMMGGWTKRLSIARP